MRREIVRPLGTASGARIDQVIVDEAETVAGRDKSSPYLRGLVGSITFGPQDRLATLVAAAERLPRATQVDLQPAQVQTLNDIREAYRELIQRDPLWPAVELAARLVTALQRDRHRLELAEDADRALEQLTAELGEIGAWDLVGEVEVPGPSTAELVVEGLRARLATARAAARDGVPAPLGGRVG